MCLVRIGRRGLLHLDVCWLESRKSSYKGKLVDIRTPDDREKSVRFNVEESENLNGTKTNIRLTLDKEAKDKVGVERTQDGWRGKDQDQCEDVIG